MLAILFALLVVLLALAVPVGVVLLVVSLFPAMMDPSTPANFAFVIRQMVGGLESTPLLAVPMFVLSGVVMAKGGVSKKIFDVFAYFLGRVTAGMPCAVVVTCLFYGAISGSAPATTAAVGTMTIPILVSMGYDLGFAASLVAVAGGLGVIIPPSIPIIMYCMSSGESVDSMFIAGVLPGLLIGALLMLYAWAYCKIKGENKEKIHQQVAEIKAGGFWKLFKNSFWALLSPVIILGGIYSAVVPPTEAAVLSVVYALIVSLFIYRTLSFKDLIPVFVEGVKTYAPVVFIVSAATAFGRVLAILQVPQVVATWVGGLGLNKVVLILMVNLLLLIVGMIMDTGPAIMILTPILLPIVEAVGVNPIHFGIIMVVNLAIDFSELYLSLSQGMIDSQENPYDIIDANKFYEVQKYLTNSNHIYHTISVNIGTSTYDAMPAEYRAMIDEVCAEVERKAFQKCDESVESYKASLIEHGMQFVDFDQIDGMRETLAQRTSGMIDIVRKTVNNDTLVDAYLAAAEAAKAE